MGELNEQFEVHHTFFPKEVSILQHDISKDLGVPLNLILSPLAGYQHVPLERLRSKRAPQGLFEGVNEYVSPEIKDVLSSFVELYPDRAQAVMMTFSELTAQLLQTERASKGGENRDPFQQLVDATAAYGKSATKDPELLHKALESFGLGVRSGSSNYYLTPFIAEVFIPATMQFPELIKVFIEQMKPVAYHEAGHQWNKMIVPSAQLLSDDEYKILVTTMQATETMWRQYYAVVPDDLPAGDAIHKLGETAIAQWRVILPKLPERLREKAVFQALWGGMDEDMARSIELWKTGAQKAYYDNELLHLYYMRCDKMPYKGNDGINEMVAILQKSGLQGLKRHFVKEQHRLRTQAKQIVGMIR